MARPRTLREVMLGLLDDPYGPCVVVLVSYGAQTLDGFEVLGRSALEVRLQELRTEALTTQSARVLCLHVPHDTVPPVAVMRVADVVLDEKKARHG